jgi:hypothetical protein
MRRGLLERFGYGPEHLYSYELRTKKTLESRRSFKIKMGQIRERRGEMGLDLWCASWANNRIGVAISLATFVLINAVAGFGSAWGWLAAAPYAPFLILAISRALQSHTLEEENQR